MYIYGDNAYFKRLKHILMSVHEITQIDPDVWKYITKPVGTGLVRVSSDEFEEDDGEKEIFFEKRA